MSLGACGPRHACSQAWLLVSFLLFSALLVEPVARWMEAPPAWRNMLIWQPGQALSQPWRWWTPVAVHLDLQHWIANAAGTLLVGCLGWVAGLPRKAAMAWCMAWPLTHLTLLLRPELQGYAGASGVLHAGVAVTATWLVSQHQDRMRWMGAILGVILIIKITTEAPWGPVLQAQAGWDFYLAPWAHAAGVGWGGVCALWVSKTNELQGRQ